MRNYRINTEKVLMTELGNEGVAFVIDKNEYLSLNETMFSILKGVKNEKSVEEITTILTTEYDVDVAECRKEVENSIIMLHTIGIITDN